MTKEVGYQVNITWGLINKTLTIFEVFQRYLGEFLYFLFRSFLLVVSGKVLSAHYTFFSSCTLIIIGTRLRVPIWAVFCHFLRFSYWHKRFKNFCMALTKCRFQFYSSERFENLLLTNSIW